MPVSKNDLRTFAAHLKNEGRSPGTIDKYFRDSTEFSDWMGNRKLTRETAAGWREYLLERGY